MTEKSDVFRPVNLSEVFRGHKNHIESDAFLSPLVKSAILSHVGCLSMVLRTVLKKEGYSAKGIDFSYAVCYERHGQPKAVNINVTLSGNDIDEVVFRELVEQAHLSVPCQQALENIPVKIHTPRHSLS